MHVRCLSRPLFVTIFENFVSAVCHVRCLSRNFQKVMSRVRCLSRKLVSAVCHVHCLSQKFQKIMSRVRCLSRNLVSAVCHDFVTVLSRFCDVYIRNSFQFVSRLRKQHEGVRGRGHELNQNRDTNMDTNTNKNRDTAIVKKSSIIWSA